MIAFENQKVVRLQRFFLLRKKMFSFSKVKTRETSSGAGYAQSCRLKTRELSNAVSDQECQFQHNMAHARNQETQLRVLR